MTQRNLWVDVQRAEGPAWVLSEKVTSENTLEEKQFPLKERMRDDIVTGGKKAMENRLIIMSYVKLWKAPRITRGLGSISPPPGPRGVELWWDRQWVTAHTVFKRVLPGLTHRSLSLFPFNLFLTVWKKFFTHLTLTPSLVRSCHFLNQLYDLYIKLLN